MALYEQVVIYAADDATILATISSDPAAAHPHLDGMDGQGEAQINFIQGTASIGQLVFRVLDVPTIAGDQQSGYFTSILADAGGNMQLKGRRIVFGRQQVAAGAYVTQYDGQIEEILKETGANMVFYRVACRDIRERTRLTRIFTKANGTTVMPRGVINGYGQYPISGKMVPPVTPLHGTFLRDPNGAVAAQSGHVKLDVEFKDLHMTAPWAAELLAIGAPVQKRDALGNLLGTQFSEVKVYWRAEGSGGAYNVLANMPVVSGTNFNSGNVFPYLPLDSIDAMVKVGWIVTFHVNMLVVMNAAGAVAIPTNNQRIEMYVEYVDVPTDRYPLFIEGTAGQIYKNLLDGVYSDYNPSIRYDAAAMAAMVTNTPYIRVPIKAPEADLLSWSETNILKPLGYAPAVINGLLTPIKYALPDNSVALLNINDAIAREDASWSHPKDGAINTIDFKYEIESLRAAAFTYDPEIDRIQEAPGEVLWQNVASAALLGLQDVQYTPVTIRSFTGGGGVIGISNDLGGYIAGLRVAEARDRFLFGDQRISVPCLRSDAGVAAAKVGDWAQVQLSWLPELSNGRLSTNRLMQVVRISETDRIWRTFELSDAGPGVAITSLPVLGALALNGLYVNAPVTSVPAAGEARVDFAIAAAQPAPDSGLWAQGARLAANGTASIGPFLAGQTIWVRVRGEQVGKRRSAWTAGSSITIAVLPAVTGQEVVTFDASNTPTVTVPVDVNTLGVRFSYAVVAQGTDFTGAWTATADVAVAAGVATLALPVTVPFGQALVVAATPYTGFAAGAVTGTAGVMGEMVNTGNFGSGAPILPIGEEISSTTGTVGTLTLQVTDPQLRLTKVEFAHQSGNGAWSAWVQDSVLPYADSVTISESMGGKIAYRITAYDANGVLRVIKTNEIAFTLGNAPEIPKLSLAIDPSGHLIGTLTGDSRTASMLTVAGGGADPTLAAIRAGNLIASRVGSFDFGLATPGTDYHVGVLAYTGAGGTGAESSAAFARITRPVVAVPSLPPFVEVTQTGTPTQASESVYIQASGGTAPLQWRYRNVNAITGQGAWSGWNANSGATLLPYTLAVTRALKWGIRTEVEVLDAGGLTSFGTWDIQSKMDFFADNGDPIRSRTWDDGGYPHRATNATGLALHASSIDSRSASVNAMFRTPTDTLDSVIDGGTYGRPTYTRLGYADRAGTALDGSSLLNASSLIRSRGFSDTLYGLRSATGDGRQLQASDPYFTDTSQYVSSAYQRGYHNADNVADGAVGRVLPFAVIPSNNILVRGSAAPAAGPILNYNPEADDSTIWPAGNIATITGGVTGSSAIVGSNGEHFYETRTFPWDNTKRYRVSALIRKTAAVTAGNVYLGILNYDAAGAIQYGWGGYTYWSMAAASLTTSFVRYSTEITPNSLNAGTTRAAAHIILGYPNTGGGRVEYQDIKVEEALFRSSVDSGAVVNRDTVDTTKINLVYQQLSNAGHAISTMQDARAYLLNAHFNTTTQNFDNVSDGATYLKVAGINASHLVTPTSTIGRGSIKGYKTNAQTLTTATISQLTLDTAEFTLGTGMIRSANQLLVNDAVAAYGVWMFIAQVGFAAAATNDRHVEIRKNGTVIAQATIRACQNAATPTVVPPVVAIQSSLANGDAFDVYVTQDSGGNLAVRLPVAETFFAAVHLW